MKYSDKDQWHKGRYKQLPNHVVATDASEASSPQGEPFVF
jgi:hypothetical protein